MNTEVAKKEKETDGREPWEEYKLSEKQSAFVSEYLTTPGDPGGAADRAGYKNGRDSARRLLGLEKIRSAIQAATASSLAGLAPLVEQTFREIMQNPDPSPQFARIRLDAAKTVADRLGYVFHPEVEKEQDNQGQIKDAKVLLQKIQEERQALEDQKNSLIEQH